MNDGETFSWWGAPRVKVVGAPGFADFRGRLLFRPPEHWEVRRLVIGIHVADGRDMVVVPEECVQLIGPEANGEGAA